METTQSRKRKDFDQDNLITYTQFVKLHEGLNKPPPFNKEDFEMISSAVEHRLFSLESASQIIKERKMALVDLSRNRVNEIPDDYFESFSQIKILYLEYNNLKVVPKSIGYLRNLKKLNLSCNFLTSLPQSFVELGKLEVLDLQYNSFTEFPSQTLQLPSLHTLILFANRIEQLPDEIAKIKSLKKLDIECNPIKKIPAALLQMNLEGTPLKEQLKKKAAGELPGTKSRKYRGDDEENAEEDEHGKEEEEEEDEDKYEDDYADEDEEKDNKEFENESEDQNQGPTEIKLGFIASMFYPNGKRTLGTALSKTEFQEKLQQKHKRAALVRSQSSQLNIVPPTTDDSKKDEIKEPVPKPKKPKQHNWPLQFVPPVNNYRTPTPKVLTEEEQVKLSEEKERTTTFASYGSSWFAD